jgi:hypothetical protein
MAEWSIAAVLKTADCNRSGGSNPSLSAPKVKAPIIWGFFYFKQSLKVFEVFKKSIKNGGGWGYLSLF